MAEIDRDTKIFDLYEPQAINVRYRNRRNLTMPTAQAGAAVDEDGQYCFAAAL
jgi:hypothetical protein